MANEVFISYSRADYQKVRSIKETIGREVGIDCWMDLDGIESDQQFVEVIINAINCHDTMLFMMSEASMQSKWALDELAFAEKKQKRIVLVRLDKGEMPDNFYFSYHSKDQIDWSNKEQRNKLLSNLKKWFALELKKEESKRKAEEEARIKAKEEALRKAEEDIKRQAEKEAKIKAKKETNQIAESEAKRKAKEETRKKVEEASLVNDCYAEWEEVKRSNDIFRINDFKQKYPDCNFISEIRNLFFKLRDDILKEMKREPMNLDNSYVKQLINSGIFSLSGLKNEGLVTDKSWETLMNDRSYLPHMLECLEESSNFQAPSNSTDVFFFGLPNAGGRTCLLMSLAGYNGHGFNMDLIGNSGRYVSALQQYYRAGITPDATPLHFCTAIRAIILGNRGKHTVNFIEMSGEEFALEIVENSEVKISNIDTPICKLLSNGNRKIFFFNYDPSSPLKKIQSVETSRNEDGEKVKTIRKKYVSQVNYLTNFMAKLQTPENAEIMQKVDAIHILVPKVDLLGSGKTMAELFKEELITFPLWIENCCKEKGIRHIPQIIPFSIGKFYLGGVFESDPKDTDALIDIIRNDIEATKKTPYLTKFFNRLLKDE